jgi:hypothetical protein
MKKKSAGQEVLFKEVRLHIFLFYITSYFQIWKGEVIDNKKVMYVCITRLVVTTKLSRTNTTNHEFLNSINISLF